MSASPEDQSGAARGGVRRILLGFAGSRSDPRELTRAGIVAMLCAGALVPAAAGMLPAGAVVVATLAAAGNIGANVLTRIIEEVVDRLRRRETDQPATADQLIAELTAALRSALERDTAETSQLRREIAALLTTGATREALETVIETGDEELRTSTLAALHGFARDVEGFDAHLVEQLNVIQCLQEDLVRHGSELRDELELNRRRFIQMQLALEQLTAQRPDAGRPAPALENGRAPYCGLRPFGETDAEIFHGRAALTAELAARVAETLSGMSMTLVSGPSGAGKSSLLMAGLLPAVAGGRLGSPGSARWPRMVLCPTAAPLDELAARIAVLGGLPEVGSLRDRLLREPGRTDLEVRRALLGRAERLGEEPGRLVLVVDQFEELFTLVRGEQAEQIRDAFVTALLSLAQPGPDGRAIALVLIAVRADFLGACTNFPGLVPVLRDSHFVVGPMTATDLRLAVTAPAAAAGLTLEDGLVDTILADLRGAPSSDDFGIGVLPLLSQTMLQLWTAREEQRLTCAGYEAIGGVHRAIQVSAEEAYSALPESQRELVRPLLLRMVVIAQDGQVARRPVPVVHLHETLAAAQGTGAEVSIAPVLDAFTRQRLLVVGEGVVEIAHEAVLRGWPRLRRWIEERSGDLPLYHQIVEDAAEWRANRADRSFLYRGVRLQQAGDFHRRRAQDLSLPPDAVTFLDEARQQAARGRRARRLTAGVLVLITAAASATAVVATRAFQDADAQQRVARSRQLAAEAESMRDEKPLDALAHALDAMRQAPTGEARSVLVGTLATSRYLGEAHLTGEPITRMAHSPDGRWMVTAVEAGELAVWALHDGRPVRRAGTVRLPDGWLRFATVHLSGSRLLASGTEGVRLWQVTKQGELTGLDLPRFSGRLPERAALSHDGRMLATVHSRPGSVRPAVAVWDIQRPDEPERIATLPAVPPLGTGDPVFSPDARRLAVVQQDTEATVVDARRKPGVALWTISRSGRARRAADIPPSASGSMRSAVFSADSRMLGVAAQADAELWDVSDPARPRRAGNLNTDIGDTKHPIAFHPTRPIAAFPGQARSVVLAETTEVGHRPTADLAGHRDPVSAFAFSATGTSITTAGFDRTMIAWDAREWSHVTAVSPSIAVPATPFGSRLSYGRQGGRLLLAQESSRTPARWWQSGSLTPLGALPGSGQLQDLTVASPDGDTTVHATPDFPRTGHLVEVLDVTHPVAPREIGEFRIPTEHNPVVDVQDTVVTAAVADGTGVRITTARRNNDADGLLVTTRRIDVRADTAAFDGTGRLLATWLMDGDGAVALWDITGPEPAAVGTLPAARSHRFHAIEPVPGGDRLAVIGDSSVTLWDIHDTRAPRMLYELPDVGNGPRVAFDPTGRLAVTSGGAGADSTALWDISDDARPIRLSALPRRVDAMAFRHDGKVLATLAGTRLAEWDVSELVAISSDPVAAGCARLRAAMTPEEWARHRPDVKVAELCG